jgi:predicted metallo-beta-lactamase superfamily hydrolase
LAEKPELLIVGGPPSYLAGYRVKPSQIDTAMKNLGAIVERVPVTILDHHLLRDFNWRDMARQPFEKAEKHGHKIVTAAEYAGKETRLLEAERKTLHKKEPLTEEFAEWTRIPIQQRRKVPPPI